MNQRKRTNSRGKTPRTHYRQVIIEKPTIKRVVNEEEVTLPNPRYPGKRTIVHAILPV